MNLKLIDLARLKNDFTQARIILKKRNHQSRHHLSLKTFETNSVDVSGNLRNSWPKKLISIENHLNEIGKLKKINSKIILIR
jgi:hypothetical protein